MNCCSGTKGKPAGSQTFAKAPQRWDAQKPEQQEGAAGIEDQVIHIAGADHEPELHSLHRGHNQQDGRQKHIPAPHRPEEGWQEEGEGHKGAEIAKQIEQGIAQVDIAVEHSFDVNRVDAFERAEVDEPAQIILAGGQPLLGQPVRAQSQPLIQQGKGENHPKIEQEKNAEQKRNHGGRTGPCSPQKSAEIGDQADA